MDTLDGAYKHFVFSLLILLLAFIGSAFLSSQNSKGTIASLWKMTRDE